ncbi:MAG: alpha/beta hydrolase [Rickettsiaceae bacterium]
MIQGPCILMLNHIKSNSSFYVFSENFMSKVFLNGQVGRIEGFYSHSRAEAPLALLLHPHPEYHSVVDSDVMNNIYDILFNHGYNTLKINFRGIGLSEGSFDCGTGEMIDAATALDWLQAHNQNSGRILVVGLSFGAWIAMQLIMRRPEINDFIAISPPVDNYDFSFLSPCPISGMFVRGSNDSVVLEESVLRVIEKLQKQSNISIEYQFVRGADHFFRGKVKKLGNIVQEYITSHSPNKDFIIPPQFEAVQDDRQFEDQTKIKDDNCSIEQGQELQELILD